VVDESVPANDLQSLIVREAGNILSKIELFDLYRGNQIPEGKKSLSYSITFQSPDRTLQEEDVDPVIASILKELKDRLGASLRS
jgi:phenylalanyl-tRNA synthetase beta chain